MSVLRYQPLTTTATWPGDVFRLFDSFATNNSRMAAGEAQWQPGVDILEFDDHYQLIADVPGVDPASIDITVNDKVLTVSGERQVVANSEEVQRRRLERPAGQFSRQFTLPDTADDQSISARSEHGVIHINISFKVDTSI